MVEPGLLVGGWDLPPLYIVLVGITGIVVWHLIPKRFSNARLIIQIAFFLAMSALLLHGGIVPYEPIKDGQTPAGQTLVGLAKALWWIHLAWALIGFVRIYLVFERKPREARLLQDIVIGVVYAGVLLSVLAFVFGMPVGTLIATSGVFAIILGLALQNTLSDLFSGIALNLGRPYVLGDWIMLGDGTEGRVVETNWQSTHLLTAAHNVVALPNSFLAKVGLTNISSPDESHGMSLTVRLAPTGMPAVMADVMHTALSSAGSILREPPPSVTIRSLDATAIEFELSFRVANVGRRIAANNEIFDLVYRHSKSAGLLLAVPPSASIAMSSLPGENTDRSALFTPIELIRTIPIFSALTQDEQETLAATVSVRAYRKGDIIARQGEMLPSLMIVRTGVIAQLLGNDDGAAEIARLAPGDFFGETGLLAGIGETSTLQAVSRVLVYVIDQDSFAPLLADRPEMAEDLAAILSSRAPDSSKVDALAAQNTRSRFALLKAIRRSFGPFRSRSSERSAKKAGQQD